MNKPLTDLEISLLARRMRTREKAIEALSPKVTGWPFVVMLVVFAAATWFVDRVAISPEVVPRLLGWLVIFVVIMAVETAVLRRRFNALLYLLRSDEDGKVQLPTADRDI